MITIIRRLKNKIYYFVLATFIILSLSTETLHPACASDVDLDGNMIANANKIVFGGVKYVNTRIYSILSGCAGREPTASEINKVTNSLWIYRSNYIKLCTDASDGVISAYSNGKTYVSIHNDWNSINICGTYCDADAWKLTTTSTGGWVYSESWVYWDHPTASNAGWCRIDYTGSATQNCNVLSTASNRFGLPAVIGIVVNQ